MIATAELTPGLRRMCHRTSGRAIGFTRAKAPKGRDQPSRKRRWHRSIDQERPNQPREWPQRRGLLNPNITGLHGCRAINREPTKIGFGIYGIGPGECRSCSPRVHGNFCDEKIAYRCSYTWGKQPLSCEGPLQRRAYTKKRINKSSTMRGGQRLKNQRNALMKAVKPRGPMRATGAMEQRLNARDRLLALSVTRFEGICARQNPRATGRRHHRSIGSRFSRRRSRI